jgi:DNA ligase-1
MSEFPVLYKRNTNGSIQRWHMEVEGSRYRSISGQVDGALVTSAWTQAEGKNIGRSNATNAKQQAIAEVEAEYVKKGKRGYKEEREEAATAQKFSPMLAKPYEDHRHKLEYPVFVQPKLDGIRILANRHGLWSRTGEKIVACPHIEEAIQPVFREFPDATLDGEGYDHDLKEDFNTITSLMRKTNLTSEHIQRSAELVQYHVYDFYDPRRPELFYARSKMVESIVEGIGLPLVLVPTIQVEGPEHIQVAYEAFLDDLYEGAIVRANVPYQQKRTDKLLKLKSFVDAEFKILSLEEGRGNASGGIKIAWLQHDTDPSKKFKADVMGTVAHRKELLKRRKELIGKMATVKMFAQRTPDGIPRWAKLKVIHEQDRW